MSDRPIANCYWVVPQRLLAGEYPLARADGDDQKLRRLLSAGIDCFLDLTETGECPPYDQLLPSTAQYIRKSVPDHDVPREPLDMREILGDLAAALAAGRRVYVHCRAGIGRTGTAVGCFLVEQGYDGKDALVELNRLWRQSERSQSWPTVPQTPEQEEYVRDWQCAAKGSVAANVSEVVDVGLSAVAPLRERYLGAMLGLAIGDALAAATQFRRPGSFSRVGDMLGGGPYDLPLGGWSDDTAMALCLADSLGSAGIFDAHDQVERYLQWQSEGYLSATGQCVGITAATAKALAASQWRRQPFAGLHDPAQLDPEVLSRVAPAVLYAFPEEESALELAVDAARVTNQAPLVLDACRVLAAALLMALRGATRQDILHPPAEIYGARAPRAELVDLPLTSPAMDARRPAGADALTALQTARWAFASTDSFREGALAAINCGGHSDVIGAVYGQLAGAFYGVSAIPPHWRAALMHRERIEALADRLLATALTRMGERAAAR